MDVRNRLRRWFEELGWTGARGAAMQPRAGSAAASRQERGPCDEHEHEHERGAVTEHPFATFELPVGRPDE